MLVIITIEEFKAIYADYCSVANREDIEKTGLDSLDVTRKKLTDFHASNVKPQAGYSDAQLIELQSIFNTSRLTDALSSADAVDINEGVSPAVIVTTGSQGDVTIESAGLTDLLTLAERPKKNNLLDHIALAPSATRVAARADLKTVRRWRELLAFPMATKLVEIDITNLQTHIDLAALAVKELLIDKVIDKLTVQDVATVKGFLSLPILDCYVDGRFVNDVKAAEEMTVVLFDYAVSEVGESLVWSLADSANK